jgi:hypothetical protein
MEVVILSSIVIWSRAAKLLWRRSLVENCALRENIARYGENGDKWAEHGEIESGKRWKNGLEAV